MKKQQPFHYVANLNEAGAKIADIVKTAIMIK